MTNSIAKSKSFVLLGIFLAVPLIFGINYAEAQSASQGE
jgi:hypothetical protein